MPKPIAKHDVPHKYTAFNAGQDDFIDGKKYNPFRFNDEYRQKLYEEGFAYEESESCPILPHYKNLGE